MMKLLSRFIPLSLLIFSILACSATTPILAKETQVEAPQPEQTTAEIATEPTPTTVYLPVVTLGKFKFLGYIDKVYWSKENVEKYVPEFDALAGKKHTAVGWFIDIQDPAFFEPWETDTALNRNNLYRQLEQLWLKGYVSFVKIGSTDTASKIIDGVYDDRLTQMAKIYLRWVQNGGGRIAMLAPLQEMNGDWIPYYPKDMPVAQKQQLYKSAYLKIQQMFYQNGVRPSQVWWVFAANGMSSPDTPENGFEYYYPGDQAVDIVGFASYNYGYCAATYKENEYDYGRWENYDSLYEPYIRRLEVMAPGKPIIITETGTSAIRYEENRPNNYDYPAKAGWFITNYNYLASQPSVLGIFYFDINEFDGTTCDLKIPRNINFTAYQQAVSPSVYQYLSVNQLTTHIP